MMQPLINFLFNLRKVSNLPKVYYKKGRYETINQSCVLVDVPHLGDVAHLNQYKFLNRIRLLRPGKLELAKTSSTQHHPRINSWAILQQFSHFQI